MNNITKIIVVISFYLFTTMIVFAKCDLSSSECRQLQALDKAGALKRTEKVTTATDKFKKESGAVIVTKPVPKPYEIPVPKYSKPKKITSPSKKKVTTPRAQPTYKKAKPIDMNIFGPQPKTPTTTPKATAPKTTPTEEFKFEQPKSPLQPVIGQPPGIIYQ